MSYCPRLHYHADLYWPMDLWNRFLFQVNISAFNSYWKISNNTRRLLQSNLNSRFSWPRIEFERRSSAWVCCLGIVPTRTDLIWRHFDLVIGKINDLLMGILTSKLQLYKVNEAYVNDPESVQDQGFDITDTSRSDCIKNFQSQGKIKTAHGDSLLHLAAKTDNLVLAKAVLRLPTSCLICHLK